MCAQGYRYDVPGRLVQADFGAYAPASFGFTDEVNRYRFSAASYDANGNLLTLRRTGQVAAATRQQPAQFAELDNLRYTYAAGANRLLHVDDLALAAPTSTARALRPDVQDRLTAAPAVAELSYDNAGSATRVSVEGLSALSYNHLNLTRWVVFSSAQGDSLVYRWAADGQKVGAVRYVGGQVWQRTDYVAGGAWVYEQDTLRYWRTGEGRALWQPTNAAHPLAYEYSIADHLGNVRVSFRPGEPVTSRAGLSLGQRARETQDFDYLSIERPRTAATHASDGDGYVARLHTAGTAPVPFGPTKSLAVQKGDTVRVTANFLYDPQGAGGTGVQVNLLSLVASWLTQTPPGSVEGRAAQPSLPWVSVALGSPLWNGLWSSGVPRAYLRVVAFDTDSAVVSEQVVPITSAAANNWQALSAQLVAPADGHVLVYVATESERAVDVDVDEVVVRYGPALQVQEQHYDPFGLELVGLSRSGLVPTNRYLFNGKEAQAELGLTAWTDHGWRLFDAALGRWHVVDPAFDEAGQISWSTYQFGFDNPVRYNDLDGRVAGGGPSKKQVSTAMHTTLDLIGLIPGAGEVADGLNAVMYLAEGNKVDAALSVAAMVPLAGMAATGAKLLRKANQAADVLRSADKLAGAGEATRRLVPVNSKVAHAKDFDTAREAAFDKAGMTNPDAVTFSKIDPKTGTVVEFKGENGAKVAYDSPHPDRNPATGHDKPHVGWQQEGKRGSGGAGRGNITYDGPQHPHRP